MQHYWKLQSKGHSNLTFLLLDWKLRPPFSKSARILLKKQYFHSFIVVEVQCKVPSFKVWLLNTYGRGTAHCMGLRTISRLILSHSALIVVRQKCLVTFFRLSFCIPLRQVFLCHFTVRTKFNCFPTMWRIDFWYKLV